MLLAYQTHISAFWNCFFLFFKSIKASISLHMMKSTVPVILVSSGSTLFSDCESHFWWVTNFEEKSFTEFKDCYDGYWWRYHQCPAIASCRSNFLNKAFSKLALSLLVSYKVFNDHTSSVLVKLSSMSIAS